MSLEEKAQEVARAIGRIQDELQYIQTLCSVVLLKYAIDEEIIQLSKEDKKKLIQEYARRKEKLKGFVEALP